jgi:riboflavin kinase/FMN adenylyltransferase
VCFEPLPGAILRPECAVERLTSAERRRELLIGAGADVVDEIEPSLALLDLEALPFIGRLHERLQFDAIVEGPDFRFARGRSAGMEKLALIGAELGFTVHSVQEQLCRLEDQSVIPARSSNIRWLLANGRVVDAARLLSRHYSIEGTVESGAKAGRTLGFPTANIATHGLLVPADGVYAGLATLPDGTKRIAAVSIGTKPSLDTNQEQQCFVEAHLLDHDAPVDDYGWRIEVQLLRWVREQYRLPDLESLCSQIERDIALIRTIAKEEVSA